MHTIENLQKLGLSESEAAVFLFLSQYGPSSGPQIQTGLDMAKVPVYRALTSLTSRDLVVMTGDKRRQRYIAQSGDQLLRQYDQSITELRYAKTEMQTFLEALASKDNQLYKERQIRVFEGTEGYRLWINERMRDEGSVIRQIAHGRFWETFADSPKIGDTNTQSDGDKRAAKGIELRSIFTTKDIPLHAKTIPSNLKATRYLPMPTIPAVNLSTFGTRVAFYSGQDGVNRGVIIQDSVLASLLTAVFDILWEQASPL